MQAQILLDVLNYASFISEFYSKYAMYIGHECDGGA